MKGLFEELQVLMQKYRFKPQRKLSQNFLISQPVIDKLVDYAGLESEDVVLEIGCGTGFLTRELLKHCKVVGFETDEALQQALENEVQSENFKLLKENFLESEIPEFSKIVSAPPYSISSEIMHALFQKNFKLGVLLFEKAFVDKITSFPGFKDYCATAVLTQYFFSIEALDVVAPESFFPKPKTHSQILRFSKEKTHGVAKNDELFVQFVSELFRYKNKNLRNALQHSEGFVKARMKTSIREFEDFLENSEFSETKVYLVEVEEFIQSFNKLCKA